MRANRTRRNLRAILLAASAAIATVPVASQAQAATQVNYNIPAQDLSKALMDLARQSGREIYFSSDITRGKKAPTLRGAMALETALSRLLRGSGLTYRTTSSGSIVVQVAAQAGGQSASQTSDSRSASSSGDGATRPQSQDGEVIVVTARRREESLNDAALSISALGEGEIDRRNLVSSSDYLRTIPSVSLVDNGPGLNDIVIRGAYGEPFSTGTTVGVYFGDVPLAGYAIGGSADIKLIDIERVEVLRGPQGTLYGSNSLSGTIRFIPNAPELDRLGGSVNAGYSHTDRFGGSNTRLEGMLNIPIISDRLAIRAVAYRHDNSGFYRNLAGDDATLQSDAELFGAQGRAINQKQIGDDTYEGFRASLLWKPVDDLNVTLSHLRQNVSQDERPFELRGSAPYTRATYIETLDNDPALEIDLKITNLTAELDLSFGEILSSSSWIDQEFVRQWEIGSFFGAPAMALPQVSETEADVFTQELRFASAFNGPFQLIAGVYYEESSQPTAQATYFGGDPALNPFADVVLFELTLDREIEQRAVFGEATFNITDKLAAKAGGRAFRYKSRYTQEIFNSVLFAESSSDDRTTESGEIFRAGLEYKPNDNALIYGTWSQGFRLGRPQDPTVIASICDADNDGLLDGTDVPSNLSRVDSDRLESIEVGGKFTGLNGRLQLNGAAYRNIWTGIPVDVRPPGCIATTVVNGGEAEARGFELEGTATLTPDLKLRFGLGYVDTFLTTTTTAGNEGDRVSFTPKWNANSSLEYMFAIGDHEAFLRGDYAYFGSYYELPGERGDRADPYHILGAAGGIDFGRVSAQLYVQNLLNSRAITSIEGRGNFPAGYQARLRPRTIGLQLGYRF